MTAIIFFGFLIGVKHALEADHVAAVASLAMHGRGFKGAVRLGVAWGLGHTLTLFVVGLVVIMSGQSMPARITPVLELIVGVMLIALGLDVIRRMIRDRVHFHTHRHGDETHFHAHSHAGDGHHRASHHRHGHGPGHVPAIRALMVGLVHGLAGSAALVLLTLGAMKSVWMGLGYLALFGAGSLAGMALFTCVIVAPLRYAARNLTWAYYGLTTAVGLGTVVMGGFMVYRTVAAGVSA